MTNYIEKSTNPKIVSIIVTYNGEKCIKKCLSSLEQSDYRDHYILVIDNASTDNTLNIIRNEFPNIKLFISEKNHGFGKANNIGIKCALEMNAHYVFLLNQDAYITNDTIQKLIDTHHNNPQYGVLSPIHLSEAGNLDCKFQKYITSQCNDKLISDLILRKPIKDIYDVSFVNAAAWLLPKETLAKVGGFMPVFHHYGEDDNYIHRCIYHKVKIGIVPNSFITHDRLQAPSKLKSYSNKKYSNYVYSHILSEFTNPNNRILIKFKKVLMHLLKGVIRKPLATIYATFKLLFNSRPIFHQYLNSKNINTNFLK